jgi:hypothetical protein
MKSFKNLLIGCLLVVLCSTASAVTLLDTTSALSGSDPTQAGRPSRNGIPQDWANTETFPGFINTGTSFSYHTFTVPNVAIPTGRFIQVELDDLGPNQGFIFVSGYANSYSPASPSTNWLGDSGFSPNFFGTGPVFFQVVVPAGANLVLVVNSTNNAAAIGEPFRLIVEGFTDTLYSEPNLGANPIIHVRAAPTRIREGGSGAFVVEANRVLGAQITVNYSLGGNATLDDDYSLTPSPPPFSITMPAGIMRIAITVDTFQDGVNERRGETASMTIQPGAGYSVTTSRRPPTKTASIKIVD